MFLTYVYTYAYLYWAPQGPLYTYTYELVSRGALRAGCGHFLRAAKGVVSLVLPDSPAYTYARTRTLPLWFYTYTYELPLRGHRLPYVYSPWGLRGVCSINGGMCVRVGEELVKKMGASSIREEAENFSSFDFDGYPPPH